MKKNQISEGFLVKATDCIVAKEYTEALKCFNNGLRFAATKSQVLSDIFAGRAKVYSQVKQFKLSSENYQRAISECMCEEKCKVYKKSLEECDEILRNVSSEVEAAENFFTFSQPPHKKIPFIAECLEVRENDEYGRFIATTKELSPGDVVVMEEPFYKVLDIELRNTRCAVCLQQKKLNLFPCAKCNDGE
jgi:SET and MYND domain-containing protein 4